MATTKGEPKPKRAPKTEKEKKFAQKVLEGKSATQAALETYDCTPGSARQIGHENIAKLDVSVLLAKRERLSLDALLGRLEHGLYESKKIVGTRDDFIEVDDNATMHKFLETGLKAHGVLLNRAEITGKDGTPLNPDKVTFVIPQEDEHVDKPIE